MTTSLTVRALASLVPFALLTGALWGCNLPPSVGEQCESFTKTANDGMKKIEATDDKDPNKGAEAFDALASDIGKLKIEDPELKKMSEEYQKLLKDTAAVQRELATMMKGLDAKSANVASLKKSEKQLAELEAKVDKYVKEEDAFTDKVNAYCKSK